MSEAIRYLNNAKEILSKASTDDNRYTDAVKDTFKAAKSFIEKMK